MLSFKSAFSFSSFTLIKKFFHHSSFTAIKVISSAYNLSQLPFHISRNHIVKENQPDNCYHKKSINKNDRHEKASKLKLERAVWKVLLGSVQFSSVAQSCLTLRDPMNHSMPGLPVHHQLPEFTETHVHRVSDAIQPSHPLSSPSPLAPNPSQHQSLFQLFA